MNNKSTLLEEFKKLKVKAIAYKDAHIFFAHLSLPSEEVKKCLDELVSDGELIVSRNKLFLPSTLGYVKGTFIGNQNGFGFLKVKNSQEDYFVPANKTLGAINGDQVLAKEIGSRFGGRGRKREVAIVKILTHSVKKIVGTFSKNGKVCYVTPKNSKINKNIIISNNSGANAKIGQIVNVKINDYGENDGILQGEIVEILGFPEDSGVDILTVAREYNLTETFEEATLAEADTLPDDVNPNDYPNRKKFFENVITIDGADTRDIDDACSLKKEGENYRLWVHIADVNEYVKPDGALDKEAFTRGTSVYFPNMVIPMFPIKLSNGICSLHEGVYRLTLTCEMLIDKNGKTLESSIYESVIKSSHRMTYDEVQEIIEGSKEQREKFADVALMLDDMNNLAKILFRMREKRGALDFNISEAYIKVDDSGKTIDIQKRPSRDSEKIIESFMVCANEAVAEKFSALEIPFVYRVHKNPDDFKVERFAAWCNGFGETFKKSKNFLSNLQMQNFLKALKTKAYGPILSKLALRTMAKAEYSTFNIGHYGLGSSCYCHFTSPIRRYPDLTIHRIIKWHLSGKLKKLDKEYVENFVGESAENSSLTERNAEEAERDVDDMKKAEYMEQFVGEMFEGIVSGITSFGVFVELENTCEGRIDVRSLRGKWVFDEKNQILKSKNETFRLGQKVLVKLVRSCAEEKEIDFEFEEFLEKNHKKTGQNQKKSAKMPKSKARNQKNRVFFKKF